MTTSTPNGTMFKERVELLFKSFSGRAYAYDVHTAKLGPAVVSTGATAAGVSSCDAAKPAPFFASLVHPGLEETRSRIADDARVLVLSVTEVCNFRCSYCSFSGRFPGQRQHSPRSMDLATAISAIDSFMGRARRRLERGGPVAINFYGGEPLLARDLIEECRYHILRRYSRFGAQVMHSLTTNGALLTPDFFRFAIANDFRVMVSLDGPEESHDRYRRLAGGQPTHAAVMENLRQLQAVAPEDFRAKVGFIATIAPPLRLSARRDFFNTHELTRGHVLRVGFATLPPGESYEDTDSHGGLADLESLSRDFCIKAAQGDFGGTTFERGLFGDGLARVRRAQGIQLGEVLGPNGCCIMGQHRTYVSTDGSYYPCDKVSEHATCRLGDLRSGVDADRSHDLTAEYSRISSPSCLQCPVAHLCDLCITSAVHGDGQMAVEKKKISCANKASNIALLLRTYATLTEVLPPELWQDMVPEMSAD